MSFNIASFAVLFIVGFAGVVSATTLTANGNGTPNNLPPATNSYGPEPYNCGQVELDIFTLDANGNPVNDVFQYLTFNGGSGVNWGSSTPYTVTLPTFITSGAIGIQIVLSSLQGYYTGVTGIQGPDTMTTDTVYVDLNGVTSSQQNFNPSGNNFTFTSGFQAGSVNTFTVQINQVFSLGSCFVQYQLAVSNPTCISITQNGNGIPNNLPPATNSYGPEPYNCGQVELDIFTLDINGHPVNDVFQYLTFNGGSGVNMAAPYPYCLTLPYAVTSGSIGIEIVLSSLQGYYTGVTGIQGPDTMTTDTVYVDLNGVASSQQNFNPSGNNFTFIGSFETVFPAVNLFTVQINQVFSLGSCFVEYQLAVLNPGAGTLLTNQPIIPNNLPAATAAYTPEPYNCGQVELDIFTIDGSGNAVNDIFQYITFNGGSGVNMAAPSPYTLTLPYSITSGSIGIEIVLSSLQGYYTGVTGIQGPVTPSTDTINVNLNGLASSQQNFNPSGNNFTFTSGFESASYAVVNNVTVQINQVFALGSCFVQYQLAITNP